MSVNVISNSPSQDYTHPDDRTFLNYDMSPGFKPFTKSSLFVFFFPSGAHLVSPTLLHETTRCFREGYTGLPVVRVTENQKALNCVVLNYSIPVSEE